MKIPPLSLAVTALGLSLALWSGPSAMSAQTMRSEPLCQEVRTLTTIVDGDFRRLPVIDQKGQQHIEIGFDWLGDERPWLSYRVVHCDAHWQPDNLSELDYAEGFMPARLEQVVPSFNTFQPYYHCSLTFPNDEIRLTLSGNYAVLFHPEGDEENIVATACFSISEQMMTVSGEVSANTDIDFHRDHQQLTLETRWSQQQLPHLNPTDDLLLRVRQNRREDTERWIEHPSRTETARACYEHLPSLIFEAGNHWRRFEITDERYPGLHVDHLRYGVPHDPLAEQKVYVATLLQDRMRVGNQYLYDQDQQGRFLVHAVRKEEIDTEAEYMEVRFLLAAPQRFDAEGVYLVGDLTYGSMPDDARMEYDAETGLYHKELLLKQGAYNYMYRTGDSFSAIEGNQWETPNHYDVMIYYRPFGARYDRLVGTGIVK